MSFNNKKCPKCSSILDHMGKEQTPNNSKWYQITTIKLSCPYCGIELKRDKKSQVVSFVIFLCSFVLALVAVSMQDNIVKTFLYITSGCLFWGSFILFGFLVEYVENKEI